jgi:hypothetical protein
MSFTEKQHFQIANKPQSPQCQTEPELLYSSPPPLFFRYHLPLKELQYEFVSFCNTFSV